MAKEHGREVMAWSVRDIQHWVDVLNSLFKRARIDVRIVELTFAKEQIVIGRPQTESLEDELKPMEAAEEFALGGRYAATAILFSGGREIPTFTRFYLTSDGRCNFEDNVDNGATVLNEEEAERPELRDKVVKTIQSALPWIEFAIKQILALLSVISKDM